MSSEIRGSGATLLLALLMPSVVCAEQPTSSFEMTEALTSEPGDSERGKQVFVDRNTGHCVLCHSITGLDAPSQGNIGPQLDRVAERMTPAQLRMRLVDSTKINPDSAMPAYFRTQGLHQVAPAFANTPVLTAQQIEDMIAYLLTLTSANSND